jgi:hypothetical protein
MKTKRPYVISALMAMLVMTITACASGLVGSKEEKLGLSSSITQPHTLERSMLTKSSAID